MEGGHRRAAQKEMAENRKSLCFPFSSSAAFSHIVPQLCWLHWAFSCGKFDRKEQIGGFWGVRGGRGAGCSPLICHFWRLSGLEICRLAVFCSVVCQGDEMRSPTFLPERVLLSLVHIWSRTRLRKTEVYLQEIFIFITFCVCARVRKHGGTKKYFSHLFLFPRKEPTVKCVVCVVVCHCVPLADRGTSGGEGWTGWGWECHQHEKAAIRCFLFLFPLSVCLGVMGQVSCSELYSSYVYLYLQSDVEIKINLSVPLYLYLVTLSCRICINLKVFNSFWGRSWQV